MAFRTNKMPVLQEKSASGAVATFNTALAMPLASCNIAVNAWQEGSGEPSPSNARAIHGFSEVNATRCGVNLWDEEHEGGTINTSTGANQETDVYGERSKNYIPVIPNLSVYVRSPNTVNIFILEYDKNKNFIRYNGYKKNEVYTVSLDAYYIRFYSNNTTYRLDGVCINYPSTDTSYHAYTGNTYTIQFGQEVYGAEVDAVNGVARVTYGLVDLSSLVWAYFPNSNPPHFGAQIVNMKNNTYNLLCNVFKTTTASHYGNSNLTIRSSNEHSINGIKVSWTDYTNVSDFKNALFQIEAYLIYELAEPFDIQLTPTQIETLIGNNTIFADTGDIDLTYKDLDIAKRGNFREVFKLPS